MGTILSCEDEQFLEMDCGDDHTTEWVYEMLLNCTPKMVKIYELYVTYILPQWWIKRRKKRRRGRVREGEEEEKEEKERRKLIYPGELTGPGHTDTRGLRKVGWDMGLI